MTPLVELQYTALDFNQQFVWQGISATFWCDTESVKYAELGYFTLIFRK